MKVPAGLKSLLTEANLDAIAAAVERAESTTSGEIHVHIQRNLLPLEQMRKRALRCFHELGVDQTSDRSGVLLFVVLKKKKFEIVADTGINAKVQPETWREIADEMTTTIHREGFEKGVCRTIERIGNVLTQHFPRSSDTRNELPDRPSVS